jgi:hypothetical protein
VFGIVVVAGERGVEASGERNKRAEQKIDRQRGHEELQD